jgi:RimJ/RimL family protein N-acetyltransferase
MQGLIADARHRHGLEQLVLFTDEDNAPAQGLYASLGFTARGHFGLLFGVWGPERGSEWQNCQSRGRETSCGPIA